MKSGKTIPIGHLIDGKWRNPSRKAVIRVINPATEGELYTVSSANATDLKRAIESAQRAFKEWRGIDCWTRSKRIRRVAEILRERNETIARAMTEEQGKTLRESRAEVFAAADQFDWYADEARRIYGRTVDGHSTGNRLLVIHQPVGVVAGFAPWNFPCLLPARKIAAALAAGCTIIMKPAKEAPRATYAIAQACMDAGLPNGAINVVVGDARFIADTLIASPAVRKISATSSVEVGVDLLRKCSSGIKRVSMELGGHSPVIVFDDTNVAETARLCARGKFRNNGQVCIAASRFIVHKKVFDAFVGAFVGETRRLRLGNGMRPETDIGPLANRRRLTAAEELIEDARSKGARIVCGGKRAHGFKKGFYFEPTVLVDVNPGMSIMHDEPFGPVAPIESFGTFAEAIAKANATDFGLAGYVFTNKTTLAFRASEEVEAGMIGVNTLGLASAETPFGGTKHSGLGREGGSEGILEYVNTKYINIQLEAAP